MNKRHSEEIPSYRDPMGARMEAARKHREALEGQYPSVGDVYDGFYLRLDDLTEEAGAYLLGAEGIIGSPLQFDDEHLALLASDDTCLVVLQDAARERLMRHVADGWHINTLISTTFYQSESKRVGIDVAFICWAPLEIEYTTALATFTHNISERLASGDRPELRLTQEQFIQVLESGGTWYLTKTTKRNPLPKGTVVYKSRRTGTERLTAFALRHRSGCNALATIFWAFVIVGIVALIWTLFF